jgi:hypothetical protein
MNENTAARKKIEKFLYSMTYGGLTEFSDANCPRHHSHAHNCPLIKRGLCGNVFEGPD